jgi:hypothetical protein
MGVGGPPAEDSYEAPGQRVRPESFHLQQLQDRLGAAALEAIGYGKFSR